MKRRGEGFRERKTLNKRRKERGNKRRNNRGSETMKEQSKL